MAENVCQQIMEGTNAIASFYFMGLIVKHVRNSNIINFAIPLMRYKPVLSF